MHLFRKLFFCLIVGTLSLAAHAQDFHVVVDAGHGGADTGITRGDLKEKDLTLAVAQAIAQEMNTQGQGWVTLTRQGDDLLSLQERRRIASSVQNGVFLSLHFSLSSDPVLTGTHVFMQKHSLVPSTKTLLPIEQSQDKVLSLAFQLGEQITQHLQPLTGVSKLHVSEYLLAPLVGISIPALVIELDFLSALDASAWKDPNRQQQAAKLIVEAIDQYRRDGQTALDDENTPR